MKNCKDCKAKDKGIFCDLAPNALEDVSQHKVMNTYKKGQNIFFQGNPPMGLYCVASGKIKVTRTGNDGKESIIRIAGAGDVLGHRSLFSKENYEASATVLEDATICFIDKVYIYSAMTENPTIALNLVEKLSKDMGSAEKRYSSMYQKNARERLADLLLQFSKEYGEQERGRIKLNIRLSRDEMASMVGSAHETVIRLLSEFKDEQILDLEGKIIFIKDPKKLKEFANMDDK